MRKLRRAVSGAGDDRSGKGAGRRHPSQEGRPVYAVTARSADRQERTIYREELAKGGEASSMTKIRRIPQFKSLEEEAKFWDTHSFADYWDEMKPVKVKFAKGLSEGVTVRFDPKTFSTRETAGERGSVRRRLSACGCSNNWTATAQTTTKPPLEVPCVGRAAGNGTTPVPRLHRKTIASAIYK
ncbi:MAG: BrnA antitoxin family protein [Anaerolineae bacterium]|nr:BrnA antitoxin family protein [Anaerolineae bacterium]